MPVQRERSRRQQLAGARATLSYLETLAPKWIVEGANPNSALWIEAHELTVAKTDGVVRDFLRHFQTVVVPIVFIHGVRRVSTSPRTSIDASMKGTFGEDARPRRGRS